VVGLGRCFSLICPPPNELESLLPPEFGPVTSIGSLVNKGDFFISAATKVTLTHQPNGIVDIPAGTLLYVHGSLFAGAKDGLANLTAVNGTLELEAQGTARTITPSRGTLSVGGNLSLTDGNAIGVRGNLTNTGSIRTFQSFHGIGSNALTVSKTLTNSPNGMISVGLFDSISAATLANYGTASFTGAMAQFGTLQNGGAITGGFTPFSGSNVGGFDVGTGTGHLAYNSSPTAFWTNSSAERRLTGV
jgi:hypothetical protein